MFRSAAPLAAFLAMTLASAAPAQDTGTADGDLSLGSEQGSQPGETYVAATHGDWEVRCVRTDGENDPCQMNQVVADPEGNPVAEVSIFDVPPGRQAAAGATIVTPLGTLLTAQLSLSIDENQPKRYPFSWCVQQGCFARIGFTAAELDALKRGVKADMAIASFQAPDQPVRLEVSLSGFTAAFDDISR
ncbi:invasion associated locus B family protein [Rhodovulum sp. YNF3179]|uniref:invasion associated locus B family protein n=1 Tax=Rhodovulum sp. YNF3179 TaxID=3425127 RepID=UPI003D330489